MAGQPQGANKAGKFAFTTQLYKLTIRLRRFFPGAYYVRKIGENSARMRTVCNSISYHCLVVGVGNATRNREQTQNHSGLERKLQFAMSLSLQFYNI